MVPCTQGHPRSLGLVHGPDSLVSCLPAQAPNRPQITAGITGKPQYSFNKQHTYAWGHWHLQSLRDHCDFLICKMGRKLCLRGY